MPSSFPLPAPPTHLLVGPEGDYDVLCDLFRDTDGRGWNMISKKWDVDSGYSANVDLNSWNGVETENGFVASLVIGGRKGDEKGKGLVGVQSWSAYFSSLVAVLLSCLYGHIVSSTQCRTWYIDWCYVLKEVINF